MKMSSNVRQKDSKVIDSYGFERPDDFDYKAYDDFMEWYLTVLTRRAIKWKNVMLSSNDYLARGSKMKRYVRKGIPNEHRGIVWMIISGAKSMKDEQPNMYENLLSRPRNEEVINTIKMDIPRTFPDNIYFANNRGGRLDGLYNVLIAFAHRNANVGYCQGLNFIAGLLLLMTGDEETTFWLLVVLVENILPDYYTNEMIGLLTDIEVLSELVMLKFPNIHRHIHKLELPWAIITTKWFICLYAEVLPIETVLRIWDSLFYEGSKILFRVAVSVLKINESAILSAGTFIEATDAIKSMTKNVNVLDCHHFMENVFKLPGSFPMNQITELRIKCREKVIRDRKRPANNSR